MFYDRFYSLCQKAGVTPTQAARDLGIRQSTVSMWKKQGTTPKYATSQKLAKYFGVSINYLLGYEQDVEILPDRLRIKAVQDPNSGFARFEVNATDQEAFDYGLKLLETTGISLKNHTPQALVLSDMDKLNYAGQQKAVERVRELTEIPRYRAETAPQSPPATQGDTDTTPPSPPPESAENGRIQAATMFCPICGMMLRGDPSTGKAYCHSCRKSFPLPRK